LIFHHLEVTEKLFDVQGAYGNNVTKKRTWLLPSEVNYSSSVRALRRLVYLAQLCHYDVVSTILFPNEDAGYVAAHTSLCANLNYAVFFENPTHLHDPFVYVTLVRHGCLEMDGYAALFGEQEAAGWNHYFSAAKLEVGGSVSSSYTKTRGANEKIFDWKSAVGNGDGWNSEFDVGVKVPWSEHPPDVDDGLINYFPEKKKGIIDVREGFAVDRFTSNYRYALYDNYRWKLKTITGFNSYVGSVVLYQQWVRTKWNDWENFLPRYITRRQLGNEIRDHQFNGDLTPYWFKFISGLFDDFGHTRISVSNAYSVVAQNRWDDMRFVVVRASRKEVKNGNRRVVEAAFKTFDGIDLGDLVAE